MIRFGDVYLPAISRPVSDWVAANISTSDVYEFQNPFWPASRVPLPARVANRPIQLGHLFWPTGASRWTVGHFLATLTDVTRLRDLTYRTGYSALPLVLDDGTTGGKIETDLYMLPPRPLAQIPQQEQLYLLTLVDERYFFWQRGADIGPAATWGILYATLASALGVSSAVDAIEAAYLSPGAGMASSYEYLPSLLDDVCQATGRRLVRSLDGTLTAQNPANAKIVQDAQLTQWVKQAGGLFALDRAAGPTRHDLRALVPASVTVTFQRTDYGQAALQRHAIDVDLADLNLPAYAGVTPRSGTQLLHSEGVARFTGGASPTNLAALTTLAAQAARDWYSWQLGRQDTKFAGIVPYDPEGLSDHVLWVHTDEECYTRVQRAAWNDVGGARGATGTLTTPPPPAHCRAPGMYDNYLYGYQRGHLWIDECSFQAYIAIITDPFGVWQQITCCDWRQIKCDAGGFGEDVDDGTIETDCCPDRLLPAELYITFGGALAALGTVLVTNPGGVAGWSSTLQAACGGGVTVSLTCIEGGFPPVVTWKLTVAGTGGPTGAGPIAASYVECSPLRLDFAFTNTGTCAGAATAVVTEDGIGGPGVGIVTDCCPDDAVPETLYLTLEGGTLTSPITVSLVYDADSAVWFAAEFLLDCNAGRNMTAQLYCSLGTWLFQIADFSGMIVFYCCNDIIVPTCGPFLASGVVSVDCCTANWSISEVE